MATADPCDLASRLGFLALLALLRGGEGPCPKCKGVGMVLCECVPVLSGGHKTECLGCSGSGRVAVPPDPDAGAVTADWWQDAGGDLAGLLVAFAGLTEPCRECDYHAAGCSAGGECPHCGKSGKVHDPCLSAALAAWDGAACPARAAAVRGLGVARHAGVDYWCVGYPENCAAAGQYATEPLARWALKAAVLRCYDPGNPFDGGVGVRVPMRAEGARLTERCTPRGPEPEWPHDALPFGVRVVPSDPAYEYRLDGVRVGAPPSWSWTPHALPGGRLAVTWEAWPSSLLPAAGADAGRRHDRVYQAGGGPRG